MSSQVPYANPPTSRLGVSADKPTNLQVMSPSMDPVSFNPETSTQQSVLNRPRELAVRSVITDGVACPVPDDDQSSLLAVCGPSVPPLPQDQDARSTPIRDDQSKRNVRPRTVEVQSSASVGAHGLQPSQLMYGTEPSTQSSANVGAVAGCDQTESPQKAVLRCELQSRDNAVSLLMQ